MSIPDATAPAARPTRQKKARLRLADVASWDGSSLSFTSTEAVEQIRRPALSPSTAKDLDGSCAAKWAAKRILPHISDPFSPTEIGTSAHSVLEDLYGLPAFARTHNKALNLLEAHRQRNWPGRDETTMANSIRWQTAVLNAINGLWQIENPRAVEVAGLETSLSGTSVCDIPFTGYVDRLDHVVGEDGQRGVRVVDYKSGKVPKDIGRYGDDHGDQMRLYAEAIRVRTGEMPVQASLLYTAHGKARHVPLSRPAMSKTLTSFRRAWGNHNRYVETGAFPTKASPLCGWCPLVNACPVAKANGYVDRTGVAPAAGDLNLTVTAPLASAVPVHVEDDFGAASQGLPVAETDPLEAAPTETQQAENRQTASPGEPFDAGLVAAAFADSTENLAAGVQVLPDAGHDNGEPTPGLTLNETEHPMTFLVSEDKSWFEESHGLFNANSFASTAVSGLTALAYEEIIKAGVPLSRASLDALGQTFAHMVCTVQTELSGSGSFMDGLNTRLRGFLRTYVDLHPLPFGGDEAEWDAWVAKGTKHVRSLAVAAVALHANPTPATPWKSLAGAHA